MMQNAYGWSNVRGSAQGDEPVPIWWNSRRREYIRIASDSDSGVCSVEISSPIPIADTAGAGFIGYRRISPYFIADTPTIGQNAYMRRHTAQNTGDWERGGIEDALAIVKRYMNAHPGAV